MSQIALRAVLLVVSFGLVFVFGSRWRAPNLERPESNFAGAIQVGIGDAPNDTRVFFEFHPWQRGASSAIVLGQSATVNAPATSFQVRITGFLVPERTTNCEHRTTSTCWEGDGTVTESASQKFETVLAGTFAPSGFTRIDLSPASLGDAENGPYRSLYEEITALSGPHPNLYYPSRGVEVEIDSGVGTTQARYETFFPSQPYRLYPDGWAWLLEAPGGPIGAQITDVVLEQKLQKESDIDALILGVTVALSVQITYELILGLLGTRRENAPTDT